MAADADMARAANRSGPINGAAQLTTMGTHANTRQIAVITTTAASQPIDLLDYFGTRYKNQFLRIICDQIVYYFYSIASTDTVDDAATSTTNADGSKNADTTPSRQCDMLPANTEREEKPSARYLIIKAAVGKIRLSLTSPPIEPPAGYTGT
jgi:hypothetical protein